MLQSVTMYLDGGALTAPARRRSGGWRSSRNRSEHPATSTVLPDGGPAAGVTRQPVDVAEALRRRTPDDVVLLHDRRVPESSRRIDHVAVGSSGVWVVAVDDSTGRVERRDLGSWRMPDRRLFVAGCDRTTLVTEAAARLDAVRSIVAPLPVDAALHPVLCLPRADWGILASPFHVDGVLVAGPRAVATAVAADGVLITADVRAIAVELDRRLLPV